MGLYKRGKIWWMAFTFKGRQIQKSTGTNDKRLAEAILGKIKTKIIEGRYFEILEEKERTFTELIERYMRERLISRSSLSPYRAYQKNLVSFFGQYTLSEITPKCVVEYKAKRYADKVSPATINRELTIMKAAFNLAIKEWEWCRENPIIKVRREKENNKRDRWLTDEEEKRLIATSAPWLREIIIFALNTGMRRGEILALTWKGVDLFRKTVTVFHSKNGEPRTIPINRTVIDLLKERSKVRSLKIDLVFYSKAHTAIDGNHLRRAFCLATTKVKLDDLHFHDLRHTFATRLVQAGIDIYKVQRLLGHKTPSMTQRYAHHYPESLRDGVMILDQSPIFITNLLQQAGTGEEEPSKLLKRLVGDAGIEPAASSV